MKTICAAIQTRLLGLWFIVKEYCALVKLAIASFKPVFCAAFIVSLFLPALVSADTKWTHFLQPQLQWDLKYIYDTPEEAGLAGGTLWCEWQLAEPFPVQSCEYVGLDSLNGESAGIAVNFIDSNGVSFTGVWEGQIGRFTCNAPWIGPQIDGGCLCPPPYRKNVNLCQLGNQSSSAIQIEKNLGMGCNMKGGGQAAGRFCGDPINLTTGNVFEIERDYQGPAPSSLSIIRYYNSESGESGPFGSNWTSNITNYLKIISATTIEAHRPDGQVLTFTFLNDAWTSDSDVREVLSSTINGWQYTTLKDEVESYDANGKLRSITRQGGLTHVFSYDGFGHLAGVTDNFGRVLEIVTDYTISRIRSITTSNGSYVYSYDANNNLYKVTNPDGTYRTYQYWSNTLYPHALTAVIDEN